MPGEDLALGQHQGRTMVGAIAEAGRRALHGLPLTRDEILAVAQEGCERPHELLFWANCVRTQNFGNAVKLCSIVAGKLGACKEDCKWCAQSAVAAPNVIAPQRTALGDIRQGARRAGEMGATSFGIVNSGRAPAGGDLPDVVAAATAIRDECDMEVCASLGELTPGAAAQLVAAGVTRYNHNLETSRGFFANVVTTHTYEDRLRTIRIAREAGMDICCGGIFGLGETWSDRIDLALTLRDEIAPAVVPLNFLHPAPGTPLANATQLEPMEILTIIAVFRLVLPAVDLKVAGGREHNLRDLQSWIFYAGATSCLIGNYLTTAGRDHQDDLQMIADLGLELTRQLPTHAAGASG